MEKTVKKLKRSRMRNVWKTRTWVDKFIVRAIREGGRDGSRDSCRDAGRDAGSDADPLVGVALPEHPSA